MIGGMVETRLAMSCSLAIAAGLGTIKYLDLDTPLLLRDDPFEGGYRYDGPELHLYDQPGLGIEPKYF
jgi:L-alanine-DL-glutamate epimerase-like enolase superfamily enzyme